ncbi:unnamed protein product [Acanthoscelides obtectus]|uniref:Uncharacterized protein n=1 Tax=Acanthoscelides obtectus TaxID=200917 RepID=A0A9P0KWS4_ACAOB|nr:unnamed protein product [Acanthoscelides obtectus]CAK1632831.1 hypothetical protein AOBTE_LOCUS7754 [Acanthoscelides obtectus]
MIKGAIAALPDCRIFITITGISSQDFYILIFQIWKATDCFLVMITFVIMQFFYVYIMLLTEADLCVSFRLPFIFHSIF